MASQREFLTNLFMRAVFNGGFPAADDSDDRRFARRFNLQAGALSAGAPGVHIKAFWFVRRTGWSSACRLFRAANMLRHELQRFMFATERTRPHICGNYRLHFASAVIEDPSRCVSGEGSSGLALQRFNCLTSLCHSI